MSFNKSRQRSSDGSDGKMHVAELHAVPGLTSFVDGTAHLHKTEDNRNVPSLKCEVSRAWSFSAEVEQNHGRKSEEAILEKDFDTFVDAYGSGSSTRVTQIQEACTVELNDNSADENQQTVESDKEKGSTMREAILEKDFDTFVDAYGSGSSTRVTQIQEACTVELNDNSVDENQQTIESDSTMRLSYLFIARHRWRYHRQCDAHDADTTLALCAAMRCPPSTIPDLLATVDLTHQAATTTISPRDSASTNNPNMRITDLEEATRPNLRYRLVNHKV
ncbi:unnamed protein product [Fraxinus pennsylvanica]|uniref:Uncharacterized protein n=1 Tax=Fraxinus pennsylvanica TaxID=56036 RepID=A0AAD1ZYF3_9LAMI|nr:unnamed protein product [Fraxinus pennsylvanica]